MVQLIYSGGLLKVDRAVAKANEILHSQEFYEEIRKKPSFDYSKLSPQEIATLMEQASWEITIKAAFKPIANASTEGPHLIKVSNIRFSSHLPTAVNTLIHETVHAIDWHNGELEFTHNGNSPIGQENTAPWVIGAIAESLVKL